MLGLYCAMLSTSASDPELKSMIDQIHEDQTDEDELNDWFPTKYAYFKGEGSGGEEHSTSLMPELLRVLSVPAISGGDANVILTPTLALT